MSPRKAAIAQPPIIVWFRQDLRVSDNPALDAAVASGSPIIPIYILDEQNCGEWAMGGASRWWLHESLTQLAQTLDDHLLFFQGDPKQILPNLLGETNASGVFWNRCYEPWRISRDSELKRAVKGQELRAESFNGALLFEPHTVLKADGTPYKVFTPFYKKGCLENSTPPRAPVSAPSDIQFAATRLGQTLEELDLVPRIPWYEEMAATWQPGERGAQIRLREFLDNGVADYKRGRDYPALQNVSRLSPHLHFGEISPRQVWHEAKLHQVSGGSEDEVGHFLREIVWREFSHSLLYHWPELPRTNLQSKFDAFPWRDDTDNLRLWQKGQTGYPVVDAGMRELWRTGYMHNRVRMIVGSFLVKNLLIHWHHGENWFWDTLLDADLANNSASWQWIAGCGADAAPYFRVFNPVTQGQKFDPEGEYVRRYVPELAGLPDKYIHNPWEAPIDQLDAANVKLGTNYPYPVVDLKASRERALEAFATTKS